MTGELAKRGNSLEIPAEHMYLTKDFLPGQLPEWLERAIGNIRKPAARDMMFLSALTICSYALPRIKMLHDPSRKKEYYPNLMTMIAARAASGKGVMNDAHALLEPINFVLGKIGRSAESPANSSSVAFLELLAAYDGCGITIATEMDDLSQTWKRDYGNYSHIFREAFEHEQISRARKTGALGVAKTVIKHPRLSVLLSGTFNQLQPLLGNGENGLVSRFLPYLLDDSPEFDMHVLDNCDIPNETSVNLYEQLGKELGARWGWMMQQKHDCLWSLTADQAKQLSAFFADGYHLALDEMGLPEDYAASVFRMMVTIKRIGMILTALRLDIHSELPKTIYCSDEDFKTMGMLAEQLLKHAAKLMLMLPEAKSHVRPGYAPLSRSQKKMLDFLDLLPKRFSAAEAIEIGERMGFSRATVFRYLVSLAEKGALVQGEHGQYIKTN